MRKWAVGSAVEPLPLFIALQRTPHSDLSLLRCAGLLLKKSSPLAYGERTQQHLQAPVLVVPIGKFMVRASRLLDGSRVETSRAARN